MDKKSLIVFGRDDEAIIDVCLFEDMPFSQDYTVINHWRAGDIMDLLVEEGLLTKEERMFSTITSVGVSRYYSTDMEGLSLERPKAKLIEVYTVGVSKIITHILAGANYKIEDMDRKIRDIKLKRIL
jgi:hypothetical protein